MIDKSNILGMWPFDATLVKKLTLMVRKSFISAYEIYPSITRG